MIQIHIIHPLIWTMLHTPHQNYPFSRDLGFQCHVSAMIRMISKDHLVLVEKIVTMTLEEVGVVTDGVVDAEVEADEVTVVDSVRTSDSQTDHRIQIEVTKDGDPLVVEVVGDQMTGIKEDHHQDHADEIMSGVMTMMTNVEVIVDHVVAAEVVVATTTAGVVVDAVAAEEEEAVAEMVDPGVEIEIVAVVVVVALQVYHVFIRHHVAAHGEIDLRLEWNDASPHLHILNLQRVVVEDGAMLLLQQVAPAAVVVGVAARLENHHQAALDGVVVVKPHRESHHLIEAHHLVVVVDGDHLRNHLDHQHHGDHQPKNPKRKKVKVGEVHLLQLPVPNPQLVGNTQNKMNSFGHNEAQADFLYIIPAD